MKYTADMEKAMQGSHHMGYADYCRKLENRLRVERKRQEEYNKCKHIVADLDSNIHR
ncbi:hypothetical protein [Ornithinibacillus bavariensis]|uniref:Uncharacterized protein n=1 Tax=Ornithinibacillus bavariensis TaxID=545502 RepID=A0A919XDJ7_9BACI|nr:hypothetical protein [Ornithinibacillus bavariensis]GIO28655.1 hypothetical protein J43TS3_32660 [Ornithinibacillus bavariensis]